MKSSLFILFALLLASCDLQEGEGGTSTITGKVLTINLQHFEVPGNERIDTLDQYFNSDKDVFLIYGEADNLYDDNYKTSFDGSFGFESLRKGKYTLFVYSDCEADTTGLAQLNKTNPVYADQLASTIWHPECLGGKFANKVEVEITENNQVIDLQEIISFNIVND